MTKVYEATKRVFDFLAALLLLAALSWLLVIVYVLVRLSSRGGGFFVQERSGLNGQPFKLAKFRTMRQEHRHDPNPAIVIGGDHSALTGTGRVLRKAKLDELPQLWNVLKGEMSLVGPRPTVPEQVAQYDDFKRQRLLVRPGVTGLAQVNGGTALTWDERIQWDVYYVHHCSWWMDAKILLLTIRAVIVGTEKNVRRMGE
jgi:lipopolysaccharide/colanic/teichoic acid biosynthesis glycosyltransferase